MKSPGAIGHRARLAALAVPPRHVDFGGHKVTEVEFSRNVSAANLKITIN
jgi:hypothetical protein